MALLLGIPIVKPEIGKVIFESNEVKLEYTSFSHFKVISRLDLAVNFIDFLVEEAFSWNHTVSKLYGCKTKEEWDELNSKLDKQFLIPYFETIKIYDNKSKKVVKEWSF